MVVPTTVFIIPEPSTFLIRAFISSETNEFENSEIEIINYLGQTVLKLIYTSEIDVSELSGGCYILKIITSEKQQFHSKFIKQ